jgi:hypothetical protein
MKPIRIAVAGAGNCASSQGIQYQPTPRAPTVMIHGLPILAPAHVPGRVVAALTWTPERRQVAGPRPAAELPAVHQEVPRYGVMGGWPGADGVART